MNRTWGELQQAWRQGQGGIWVVKVDAGRVAGRGPWWLKLVSSLLFGQGHTGIAALRGNLRWPLSRSTIVVLFGRADEPVVADGKLNTLLAVGPAHERLAVGSAVELAAMR